MNSDLSYKRGLWIIIITAILVSSVSIITLNYTDGITIAICITGGLFFGIFLLSKAILLIDPKLTNSKNSQITELSKEDYVIGCLSLVYVDFGFVLLLLIFVMLAMIKANSVDKEET